jgi:hypothetical protein
MDNFIQFFTYLAKKRERWTERERDRQAEIWTSRREIDGWIDGWTDKQINSSTARQTFGCGIIYNGLLFSKDK